MALPTPITSEPDVHAWRALFAGTADAGQQIRVVNWLALATGRAGVPYVSGPDGERDTLVLIGRQSIGVMIGNMSTPETLAQAQRDDLARKGVNLDKPTRPTRTRRGKPQ